MVLPLILGGCATAKQGSGTYGQTALMSFQEGMEEFEDEDFVEAHKYFSTVVEKFPYSKYAILAELRQADCKYGQDEFMAAADGYRKFAKMHPTNPEVDYALFRIGLSYHSQIPTDWFFLPPSHEKDQTDVLRAKAELETFLAGRPQSKYADQAKKLLTDCKRRLASHELYVARFYYSRDKYQATVERARAILSRYNGTELDEEAMFLLGEASHLLGRPKSAIDAFRSLIKQFPDGSRASRARKRLKELLPKRG